MYNLVSSIIVGRFLGKKALAALGASNTILVLFLAIAIGLSIGIGVVISQLYGAGKYIEMKNTIIVSLKSVAVLAAIILIFGMIGYKYVLKLLNTPSEIFQDSAHYLWAVFLAIPFIFLYNTLNSIFIAMGEPKISMIVLSIVSVINMGMTYIFIAIIKTGIAGVGFAIIISQGTSVIILSSFLIRKMKKINSGKEKLIGQLSILRHIFTIAVSPILSESVMAVGMLFIQNLVNSYGSSVIAGYSSAARVDMIMLAPMASLGDSVSTFTAQNMGAGHENRVKEGFFESCKIGFAVILFFSVITFFMGDNFMSLFLEKQANTEVMSSGTTYLKIVSSCYFLFGFMQICNGLLRGSGEIQYYMISNISYLLVFVTVSYLGTPYFGEVAIWWAIPIGRFVALLISLLRIKTGKWRKRYLMTEK